MSIRKIMSVIRAQATSIASKLVGMIRVACSPSRKTRERPRGIFDDYRLQSETPELTLLKIGLVLVSLYMLLRVDAIANGSRDLSWFDEQATDTSLWSDSRRRLYSSTSAPPPDALVGALVISSLDLAAPIYIDTRELHLNRGVGLVAAMAAPGDSGNAGIAGHRDGHFRALKDIKKGDGIEIRTRDRDLLYRVSSVAVVERHDTSLLRNTHSPTLTLVTCYPFYFVGHAPQRFIVRSELVSSHDRSVPVPRHSVLRSSMEPRRSI